jgi:hypothetical protein
MLSSPVCNPRRRRRLTGVPDVSGTGDGAYGADSQGRQAEGSKAVVILAGTNDIAGNTGPMTNEEIQGSLASMSEPALPTSGRPASDVTGACARSRFPLPMLDLLHQP